MDTNEWRQNSLQPNDNNRQINVVLNNPEPEEVEIDLFRMINTMKQSRRLYAWLILLCIVAGICAPLLLYQISKPNLTVSSVVTLDYLVDNNPVSGITAPDGTSLDLTQILSSYVLSNALKGLKLSSPVSISALRSNLKIERVLTDSSRRVQEIAAQMKEEKNTEAFAQAQNVTLTYQNKFIVTLSNGFENESSGGKTLKTSELCLLLNRVVSAYNDFLVETYADRKLPVDKFSVIDPDRLDVLDCLDQLRAATDNLNTYCVAMPQSTLSYRSWKTGHTLADLVESLQTCREVDINYLYSYIYLNGITKDKNTLLLTYQYRLRNAELRLETINKRIETISSILKNYKNDEIVIAKQDNDSSTVSSTSTKYFNELVLQQADLYQQAANIENTVDDLNGIISKLNESDDNPLYGLESQEEIQTELKRAISNCSHIYSQIKAHMEELQESAQYNSYINSTNASGKTTSFIADNLKKMIIGGAAGGAVSFGLWFLSALEKEFSYNSNKKKNKKEAVA